jgi:hypothetical protein
VTYAKQADIKGIGLGMHELHRMAASNDFEHQGPEDFDLQGEIKTR